MTARGWTVLATAVVSAVAAQLLGWSELWAVALVLAAVLGLSALFLLGRTSYAVDVDLSRDDVVVGEQAVGEVVVRNPSARAILPARIELPVGRAAATFDVPRLSPGASFDALFGIPTERRAVLEVGPVRSTRGDALGLVARRLRWTDPVALFVHPRTVRLRGAETGFLRDLEGTSVADLADDDVSFHALRDYVTGDDLRHVHWKSTARTGTMMVRQFEETRRSHLAVVLGCRADEYADEAEFELAVSVAASLGVQALADGRDVTIVRAGRPLVARTAKNLLDDLSGVEVSTSAGDLAGEARGASHSVPGASVVALVTGGVLAPSDVRRASAHVSATARTVGVQCVPTAEARLGRIGPLPLITLPDLDQLPRALARVEP